MWDAEKILSEIDEPIAFIIGSYITTGLGIARSLGRQNVPVVWVNPNPVHPGFFSKYCMRLKSPKLKDNEKKYIDFLLKTGEKLRHKGVLFTINDYTTLIILKYKRILEKYYVFPMSDFETSQRFLNKRVFYKTLDNLDEPMSKTYFPNDILDVDEISKKINYPCLIKPAFTDRFRGDFKTKLFVARNDKELFDNYKKAALRRHEIVIQEDIPGNASYMYGLNAYFDKNYKPYGTFMYHRLRAWPHEYGNGCLIENVDDPELADTVYSLFKKINYHGLIDAELKKDPRDNKFKFIEVNVRSWMQDSLPERCGINIFYLAYLDAIGRDISNIKFSIKHIKWLFLPIDFPSAIKSIYEKDLSINEWICSLKGKKDYGVFSWDDPKPFLYYICRAN